MLTRFLLTSQYQFSPRLNGSRRLIFQISCIFHQPSFSRVDRDQGSAKRHATVHQGFFSPLCVPLCSIYAWSRQIRRFRAMPLCKVFCRENLAYHLFSFSSYFLHTRQTRSGYGIPKNVDIPYASPIVRRLGFPWLRGSRILRQIRPPSSPKKLFPKVKWFMFLFCRSKMTSSTNIRSKS